MNFTNEEHGVWRDLLNQQLEVVKQVACPEYLDGLEKLDLSKNIIPEISELSEKLQSFSGWNLVPVDGLVSTRAFFSMLANKQFPVIQVIRSRKEINFYTNEAPDIFHEFFGHCPLITNVKYAECMQRFGKYTLNCSDEMLLKLASIYWATFEFGIISNNDDDKIFGAGILPSKSEIERIRKVDGIRKVSLNIFSQINATLQGHIMQPVYYTITSLEELYDIVDTDINKLVNINNAA